MLKRKKGKTLKERLLLLLFFSMYFCVHSSFAAPSFLVDQTTGCSPLKVQFTNTTSSAVSWYWDLGNGNSSTLANPSNVYTVPGTYSIKLKTVNAAGISDSILYSNFITVVGKPTASFSANTTSSCPGNNIFSFNNTSTGATTYLWDFGDGTTATLASPNHTYTYSGVFTVTLVAENSFGCQDIKILNQYITIHPKPDATITITDSASCDPATLFHFYNNAQNGLTWNWSFGDQTTSSIQNPTHTYSGQGFYPVTLSVTNSFGCTDVSHNPVNIRVGFKNWADFSVDIDTGCAPLTVNFSNLNSNVASSTWNFGDGTNSFLNYGSHTYTAGGTYSVSLIVSTTTGCVDTVYKNNLITAGVKPTVGFQYSNSTGCAPLAVQFTNTSTNYTSCQWFFGDGTSSTASNPNHIYTNGGTYSVTLQCWGPSGCTSTSLKQNIITVTKPQGLFTAWPRVGCPPLQTTFTAFSPSPGVSYRWNFGDGNFSNLQNPVHTYTTSGVFNVSLIISDPNGCIDTILKPGFVQTVNSAANYIPPPVTSGCAPLTAQFSNANSGAVAWLWNFGDGYTSTLQNPTHIYTVPGLYTVALTTTSAGGGCSQTISNFSTFNVKGGYAGFSYASSPCPPYVTNFTDTSLNAVSWYWEFDDGTTSTAQNPSHTFALPGYHSASLTITTADGCTYSSMQKNGIYFAPFGAQFYGIPMDTIFPMPVQFYANSFGATSWLWDFGDGFTSNQADPFHVFQVLSAYNVTLTISNGNCTLTYAPPPFNFGAPDSSDIDVGNSDTPLFQEGCVPLNITFTKKIPGSVSWHWNFGDGDTSNIEFPSHLYLTPGFYTVTLTILDSLGNSNVFQMDSIVKGYGPIPGFINNATLSCANTQIAITDTSSFATRWFWDMGDGTTDTIQNPFHAYPSSLSNFVITQTVSDTGGCSASISKSIFTDLVSSLLASETEVCGPDTVFFYTSLQNYASYLWDFGDGQTSSLVNPKHLYTSEGTYHVSLTLVDNIGCIHTYFVSPDIKVNLPFADFSTTGARQGCNRMDITFVNNSQNADSYLWNFSDGNNSTQTNPIHNYLQAGIYDVSLTVYRGSCSRVKSFTQYIRVDTAYANFSFAVNKHCVPITTSFQDLSANPVSWKWYFGDGDSSSVQNPVHTYYVRPLWPFLVMTDIHGCKDTVVAPNFPVFHAYFTTSADSGCMPSTIQFNNQSSTMATSYYWDFGDGSSSTMQNPSHTYTQAGVYNVMLVINNPNIGCPDTMYVPAKIKIRQPHADFTSTDLPNCAPSIVTFTNLSTDATNYLWDFGDGSSSTNLNPTHIYNSPGIFDVSLVALNGLGCSDSTIRQHYIRVLGPITNFTTSSMQGCSPLQVSFTDHSINAVDYSWNFGDGYSDTLINAVHTFQDSGSFSVSLVTKDTAGCISFFEFPQPVVILPAPNASFSVSAPGGCLPFTGNFTNTSTGYQSILWNFMDGITSTASNPVHLFGVAGKYDVELIATNQYGCADTAHLSQPVNVVPFPIPTFSTTDTIGCAPLHAVFHNNSTNLEGPQYLWDFGNGATSTDANPVYDFVYPGTYDVGLTITNSFGCSASITYYSLIQPQDSTPPNETDILSVSVLDNSSVKIIWENNPAIDLAAYVLFRYDPQMNYYRQVFTETNMDNTNYSLTSEYIDIGLNTLQNSYTYKIQAIDICGNTIPLDMLKAHTTINISSQQSGENILVTWTPYQGCPINTYELYRAAPGEQFQYLSTLPPSTPTFLDTTFICPMPYAYKVMATDLCGNTYTSYSDTSVTIPLNTLEGQIVDVVRSTVYENQSVLTEWLLPSVHPEKVTQFDIYKSNDNINFKYLKSVPSAQTDLMDYDVDVQHEHYYYKILVINACDIAEDLSGNTSTIILKGEMNELRQVHLNWTPYEGWANGVDYYILEKKDADGHWQTLKQVDGSSLFYDYHE